MTDEVISTEERKRWFIGLFAVCHVIYFFLFIPIVAMRTWSIDRRPVVVARVSDARVELVRAKTSYRGVRATIDFERPGPNGPISCHLEDYVMGRDDEPKAHVSEFELAVHPNSCWDAVRLPLAVPRSIAEWVLCYMFGSLVIFVGGIAAAMRRSS